MASATIRVRPTSWFADWQATLAVDWYHAITNGLELRTTADMFATDGYFLSPTLDPDQVSRATLSSTCASPLGDPGHRWEVALLGRT